MCDAYGIVNFESANVHVKGMGEYRPVSAFSYLGRYRLVDFPLSNMTNSGIDQIKGAREEQSAFAGGASGQWAGSII